MLDEHRRRYARSIASAAGLKTSGLQDALAAVARERFLPPGPWLVVGEGQRPQQTPDADPRHLYENVSVAIDPARRLFNGAPVFLARMIDGLALRAGERVLHVGAGLGYYSAIIGHVVGDAGAVVAAEVDDPLAQGARANLASMPWVAVESTDSTTVDGSFDAILVNAGVTHPLDAWLDALTTGGRLLVPLTVAMPGMGATLGKGVIVLIVRTAAGFSAQVLSFVAIYSAVGVRSPEIESRLGQALRRTSFPNLTRLRRDAHDTTEECWLHTERFCLSMSAVALPA
jgi:protein-L-isoaspartate(D-aspartate) O-methyltransferase